MVRQIANVGVLVAVLWVNAMAGSGSLSGESIGLIANRHTSFFLPANYVFGIWSLIYLALAAFTVFQALPAQRSSRATRAVGWWWAANGALNVAWVALFSFSLFAAALAVMVALLASVVVIHVRVADAAGPTTWGERVFVAWTFELYLAWISVALIANTFQYLTFLEWGGWGIPGETWSAVMMIVATALAAYMALVRGSWVFPLVVAWAVSGIGVRFEEILVIRWTGLGLVPVCLALTARTLVKRALRSPSPANAPSHTPRP
jgi:hypothetical protein